jgi:PKD repeat protein
MRFLRVQNKFKKFFIITEVLVFTLLFPLSNSYPNPDIMPTYLLVQSIPVTTPKAVAVNNANGKIYVTSNIEDELNIFDEDGNPEGTYSLQDIVSVSVDSIGRVYIGCCDKFSGLQGYVQVYDSNITPLFKLGSGNGEFETPQGIAIASNGDIYVADMVTDRVKIYYSNGSYKGDLGNGGSVIIPTPNEYFHNLRSITIDETVQEIIVLDRQLICCDIFSNPMEGARVQVFKMNGDFARSFGEYGTDPNNEPEKMDKPFGVGVDSKGRVYVSDTSFARQDVKIYNPDGSVWLGHITGFNQPLGIEIDDENKLYVATMNGNSIEIFQLDTSDITVTPSSPYNYGNVDIGTTASTTFTVQNDGTGDLVIGTVTDPAPPFSKAADTCTGQTIIPAATCTIDIKFAPTQDTSYAGNFSIPSNDLDEANVPIALNGTGINSPPTADAGGPYAGTEGQSFNLDGSNSTDSDGTIVTYEWDLDNNGQYDDASGVSPNVTFTDDGTYPIGLKVTDNLGATDEATATATIADTSPTAAFTGDPKSGSAPLTVNFTDNSTWYDQPLTFEWDFDNDGSTDSTAQNPSYEYTSDGIYSVKLTVTDGDGSVNSLTRTNYISVGCANLPVWIEGTPAAYYSSLQTAYDEAFDGESIYSHAGALVENIILNRNITITIVGGFDCDYLDNSSGETTISGNMTINSGTNIIESVAVQ